MPRAAPPRNLPSFSEIPPLFRNTTPLNSEYPEVFGYGMWGFHPGPSIDQMVFVRVVPGPLIPNPPPPGDNELSVQAMQDILCREDDIEFAESCAMAVDELGITLALDPDELFEFHWRSAYGSRFQNVPPWERSPSYTPRTSGSEPG